jgi:hypothetical protein
MFIAISSVVAVNSGIAQTPFTATYNLSGGGNNVTSFNYNGSAITGAAFGPLLKAGITSTSSNNNYRGSNWTTATSINTGMYIGFTITVQAGYSLDLDGINFGLGRSADGPLLWQWRSSADTYGAAIPGYSSLNGGLTNTSGVLSNPDANSSWTGNVLDLTGATYQGLTGTITFRLYGYDADAAGGTGGLQGNISIIGEYSPLGTNTSVQFASTGSTVSEGVGTVNLSLEITDEDATNDTEVDVVLITGAPGRVNSYTTQTVTFPAGSSADETVTITVTDNGLCDGNTIIGFELQNITGGQGTAYIGGNDTYDLSITDNDVCTGVSFAVTNATVSEGVGTYDVTVNISDFSTTQATSVDVALVSGDGARINGFTSQTVTFPANSGAAQTVTLTVTDNASCDGQAVLTFGLENLTGGQGTPFVGPNSSRTLTINDNDGTSGHVIARQAFDGLGTDDWAITTGAGNISTNAGGGSEVPLNQRILSGTASWQVNNANGTLELGQVDVSGYSNKEITIRLTSTSTTGSGNGADVTDIVRAFVALNGGAFPGTADVEITGFSNANYGYSATGVASTAAGTPVSVSLNPGGANMAAGVSTIRISVPDGTQSIALRVTALNNAAAEVWNVDDIQITGSYCATTYYSRGSGDVGDAIWSDNPSGTAGSATFDRFKSMVVQNGDVVNINANIRIDDFTVEAGGQVDLAANTFTISGETVEIAGGLTAVDGSAIVLNNPDGVILESAGALDLFDLTANTPGGVLTDAAISIRGTLLLLDGEFDASLGSVTLASDASGTGRLGPVGAGASYTGDMTVQRYIPAGATNWRFLGSPVAGQTVNDWKDDFYTAGFPGSHSPGFSNPVGSGILWPSIRWYDETLAYAHIDTGWVGVSSIAQELETAQGFAAWCGTGLTTTTAFTIDVTGEPHIAQSPITRDLDRTNNGAPTVDGWNAVSNPLPSPVLFSSLVRTNVEDYVYIFNPAAGNVAVWDAGSQQSTLNGTDTIQSSQAFLVQATGSGASIAFEESDKVNDRQGGFFGGSQVNLFQGVRLKLTSVINTFSDEALVSFGNGTAGVDGDDVPKMTFAHPDAPQIATLVGDRLFAINAAGANAAALEIPVKVDVSVSGTYTVTATDMANIGLTCLTLEDLLTGTITPLVEGAAYSFTTEANAGNEPRFMLRASTRVPLYAERTSCHGLADGRGTVVHVGQHPIDITWTDANGTVTLQQTIEDGVAVHTGLAAGTYGVTVSSDAGCGDLFTTFTIEEPAALEVSMQGTAASCANTADGLIDLTVLGGTAPYTFTWSEGSTEEDLVAAPGTYTVAIVDDRGCTVATPEFIIAAGPGPVAMAEASATTILVNDLVSFTNNSTNADAQTWDFGDGQVSNDHAPEHSWAIPGTYTITLTVDDGDCTDTWTAQILVEASTGTGTSASVQGISAWYANDRFVVAHDLDNGRPLVVEVLDATGRLHVTRTFVATPGRVSLPADGLSSGVWFVRIGNDGNSRTVRVPLMR